MNQLKLRKWWIPIGIILAILIAFVLIEYGVFKSNLSKGQ